MQINPLCSRTIKLSILIFHFSFILCTFAKAMKVLIINTSERQGGAAVAANRLTEALINNGVKAKMLVRNSERAEGRPSSLYVASTGGLLQKKWYFLYERLIIWLCNRFSRTNLFKVSIANVGIDITDTHEFREADIIHLHWVNQGFLSLKGIEKILQSGKPVVWTMHDMWEATAICHHAYECRRFEQVCMDCPLLKHPSHGDLSNRVFRRKQRLLTAVGNLTFVSVSEWLADKARSSALIGRLPIKVIPNAISLSRFKAIDRIDARTALDVNEPHVLAFGAARIDDPIKGFSYLVEALHLLIDSGRLDKNAVRLLLFGGLRNPEVLRQLPVPYTHLGYLDDEDRLSLVYSASDATISSSLYETFGQTLIEAMACGSIPVSFSGSGQADIITHLKNGYLADRLSAESLADGILWAIEHPIPARELRRSVSRRYAESVVANRYVELYDQLLGGKLL